MHSGTDVTKVTKRGKPVFSRAGRGMMYNKRGNRSCSV
jgi:hypothetical protein